MVNYDPNKDIMGNLLSSIDLSINLDPNKDIQNYGKNRAKQENQRRINKAAKSQLGLVDQRRASVESAKEQAQRTADSLVMEPDESRSFLDRVGNILDTPSRVFTRPLMGALMAGIYSVAPGEQAGEKELKQAMAKVGWNPLNIVFDKENSEELRQALDETRMWRGAYTAMELIGDPINFVPVGRLAKPGVKLAQKLRGTKKAPLDYKFPQDRVYGPVPLEKTTRTRVFNNQNMDTIIENTEKASDGWLNKRVATPLSKVPGIKQVIGTVNPSALVKSEVGRAALAYQIMAHGGKELADIGVSTIAQRSMPFTINADTGAVKLFSSKTAPGTDLREAKEFFWADVFQNPNNSKWKKLLTKDQQDYIKEYQDIAQEVFVYAKQNGIPIHELGLEAGERFIPRKVIGRGLDDAQEVHKKLKSVGNRSLADRSGFEKSRYYQTMSEGVEAGVRYYNDPLGVLKQHVDALYRVDAENQFIKKLQSIGKTIDDVDVQQAVRRRNVFTSKRNLLINASSAVGLLASQGARMKLTEGDDLFKLVEKLKRVSETKAGFEATQSDIAIQKIAGQFKEISDMPLKADRTTALNKLKNDLKNEIDNSTSYLNDAKNAEASARAAAIADISATRGQILSKKGLKDRWFTEEDLQAFQTFENANQRANGFLRGFNSVSSAGRMITAGLDFGGAMIQGFPALVTRPDVWAKAQITAFKALANPRTHAAWKARNAEKLARMSRYGGAVSRSEYFEAAERGTGLSRVPGLGNLLDHAGAGFNAFGDVARLELFDAMEPMVAAKVAKNIAARKAKGEVISDADYTKILDKGLTELGEHVSKMTGTVSNARLGIGATQAEIERGLLFAPRYLRSTVGLMADVVQGNIRGSTARTTMAKMLSGALIFYYGLAAATGQEPKLDPTKGDFLTIELEGNRVGFGGAWISMARTFGKIYKQGEDIAGGDDEFSKLMSIHKPEDSSLGQFLRYKAAPISGLGWDLATGRDALGREMPGPFSDPKLLGANVSKRFLPFSVQGQFDEGFGLEGDSWEERTTSGAGDFFGLRTFPTNAFQLRNERRDRLAQANGVENWDGLDPLRKRLITDSDAELAELNLEIQKYNLERGDDTSALINELFSEKNKVRESYVNNVNTAELDWQEKGIGGGEQFRQRLSRYGAELGTQYDSIYGEGSRFAPALAQLKGNGEDGDNEPLEQVAADEYIVRLVIGKPEQDVTGNWVSLEDDFGQFNYSEYERRVEDIKSRYGDQAYNNVKLAFDKSASLPPMARELKEMRDTFSPYWKVGETLADEQGMKEVWNRYKENKYTEIADDLLKQYPQLESLEKQERSIRDAMRENSALLDAFLLRYGYASKPKNKLVENMGGRNYVQKYETNIQETFPIDRQ